MGTETSYGLGQEFSAGFAFLVSPQPTAQRHCITASSSYTASHFCIARIPVLPISMSESAPAKLTKKQQKALAHRAGPSGEASKKRSAGKARKALRQNIEALPEADLDEDGQAAEEVKEVPVKSEKSKKRKRPVETEEKEEEKAEDGQQPAKKKKPSRQRFICFCGMSGLTLSSAFSRLWSDSRNTGNLPYTATAEVLKSHFGASCGKLFPPTLPTDHSSYNRRRTLCSITVSQTLRCSRSQ